MTIREVQLDDEVLSLLISLSEDWTAEDSCYGYRPNDRSDIEGNRIFLAKEDDTIVGYLFGKVYKSEKMKSIMPEGTPYFEVEELYVIPERRSQGIGEKLFRFVEDAVKDEAEYMVLSTATKNWKAIFHFYLDELDMSFWSARLFKKIS
jgi:ribosomal protein S18 acetylase RimI-like enzyme